MAGTGSLSVQPLYPRTAGGGATRRSQLDEIPVFQGQIQFRIDQKTEVLAKDNFKMARANSYRATMGSLFAASGNAAYAMQNLLGLTYGQPSSAAAAPLSDSDQAKMQILRSLQA